MEAIILAGGFGTRLRAAVPDLPKPMAPVEGRPFLEHLTGYWIRQGIDRIIFSVGYKADVIRAHFGSSWGGADISYAEERTPLGTGGGLFNALAQLTRKAAFLALNGDTFFKVDLGALFRHHEACKGGLTVAAFTSVDTQRYTGLVVDGHCRIVSRSASAHESLYVNGGVYLLEPAALASLEIPDPPYTFEAGILDALIARHAAYALPSAGAFIDIGLPGDYHRAATVLPPFKIPD